MKNCYYCLLLFLFYIRPKASGDGLGWRPTSAQHLIMELIQRMQSMSQRHPHPDVGSAVVRSLDQEELLVCKHEHMCYLTPRGCSVLSAVCVLIARGKFLHSKYFQLCTVRTVFYKLG